MLNERLDSPSARDGRAPVVYSSNDEGDPLDAFPTEAHLANVAVRRGRRRSILAVVFVVLGVLFVAALVAWPLIPGAQESVLRRLGMLPSTGMLAIDTTPSGWDVLEGTRTLGMTPLRVSLPPGRHSLVLRSGEVKRPLEVVLSAGSQVFHHLDLQSSAEATGVLSIDTMPPGAAVDVDGQRRGVSPVDVSGLTAGEHDVVVSAADRTVTERVTVAAGRTTNLVVPLTRPEAVAGGVGFLTVTAPIELQVFEGDALVGSSRNQRIMLLAGRRALRLVNQAAGFEREVPVVIQAGVVGRLTVPVPNGVLSVNAVPWAEVVLDGRVIGETPIANYALPPGSHEVILRNPKFPEQRRTVIVSLSEPARIGVDLRQ
jgi:hypothetical protein